MNRENKKKEWEYNHRITDYEYTLNPKKLQTLEGADRQ